MNPSIELELKRLDYRLSKCVQPNFVSKDDLKSLRDSGYDFLAYRWILDPITLTRTDRVSIFVFKVGERENVYSSLKDIERFERKGDVRKMIRIEGRLLGYPRCCTDSFIRKKLKGGYPERDTVIECIEEGVFKEVVKSFPKAEISTYSLFTSNFYPCRLRCRKAERIGEMLVEMDDRYVFKIVLNVINVLVPVFEVYRIKPKTDFGRIVHEFVESLGGLREKAERIVEDFKRNPAQFENNYLKRYA